MVNDQKALRAWVREQLKARGRGARKELALVLGLTPDKITRMLNEGMKEQRRIEASELKAMIDFFGKSPPGFGVPDGQPRKINIVGDIGAGEEIFALDDERGDPEPIDAPPDIGPNAVGVNVIGDSMYPDLDEGAVIVYDEIIEGNFDNFVGRKLVIALADGRRFVKRLQQGSSPELFTLRSSNPRIRDIPDVTIAWVAPIRWVKPKW